MKEVALGITLLLVAAAFLFSCRRDSSWSDSWYPGFEHTPARGLSLTDVRSDSIAQSPEPPRHIVDFGMNMSRRHFSSRRKVDCDTDKIRNESCSVAAKS
jgi:hypothetical protein